MLVAVVLLLIFVIQNSQEVDIDFLFLASVSTPLILALVFSALLGALIGWLAPRVRRRMRRRRRIRERRFRDSSRRGADCGRLDCDAPSAPDWKVAINVCLTLYLLLVAGIAKVGHARRKGTGYLPRSSVRRHVAWTSA